MAEKSSPSSSSRSSSSLYGPRGNGDDVHLIVHKQPPGYVFPIEEFAMEIVLEAPKTQPTGVMEWTFVATLHQAKTGKLVSTDDAMLAILEPQPTISLTLKKAKNQQARRIRCRIDPNPRKRDRWDTYFIRFSPQEAKTPTSLVVKPGATNFINLVKHKIRVDPDPDWEPIWYKDEGGRDKCMTVGVAMYDQANQLYKGEEIPLQMTLYYGDEKIKVHRQDILKKIGEPRISINKRSGKAILRFRIEDVSKNHQTQAFRVQISPDPRLKGFRDVAPGFTQAVSVRSKRNKRPRTGSGRESTSSGSYMSPARAGSTYSGQSGREEGSTAGATVASRPRPESAFASSEVPRLREAIKGVIQWTEEVVNGIYPLQWQVIGYAQTPDGAHDFTRPYHSMPNPNGVITRVLSMYSESTRNHLQTILTAIDQASSEQYGPVPNTPPDFPMQMNPMLAAAAARHQVFGMPPQEQDPTAMATAANMGAYVASLGLPMGGQMPPAALVPPQQQQQMQAAAAAAQQQAAAAAAAAVGASVATGRPPGGDIRRQPVHLGGASGIPDPYMPRIPSPVTAPTRGQGAPSESEVAYVLAKHFRTVRTNERLGFPAYSKGKELLGFYRESGGGNSFLPISQLADDFGPLEIMHARNILEEAIRDKSEAVHQTKEWVSIAALLDHAMVYDWSRADALAATGSGGDGDSPEGSSGD